MNPGTVLGNQTFKFQFFDMWTLCGAMIFDAGGMIAASVATTTMIMAKTT